MILSLLRKKNMFLLQFRMACGLAQWCCRTEPSKMADTLELALLRSGRKLAY